MLLAALLAYAVALRTRGLSQDAFWVDEAETSINALTILQHGVPTGNYLGLPIFENTYTLTWPESTEYEFKDSSYSSRGLAIYHGWLPLYSIAASFALNGIHPDEPSDDLKVRHAKEEIYHRIFAARFPGVLFSVVFLVSIFFAARELYGNDAAWAALAVSTFNTSAITFARQARYYSATLALSVLSALVIFHMLKRGRFRDFVLGALCFVGLFHTNMVAFVSLCAVMAFTVPYLLRRPRVIPKLVVFSGIIILGTLPWLLLTGFFSAVPALPKAIALLTWKEILRYPADRLMFVVLAAFTVCILLSTWLLRERIPIRIKRPFIGHRWAFFFLLAWAFIGFVTFVWTAPAASYFHGRITLVVLVPALLFGALMCAAFARSVIARHSVLVAVALFMLTPYAAGRTIRWWQPVLPQNEHLMANIDSLRYLEIIPGTRLYVDGGNALTLKFCTGLPIQTVMPVRKSFLNGYPSEVIFLEGPRYQWLNPEEIKEILEYMNKPLGELSAAQVASDLFEYGIRKEMGARVKEVLPDSSAEVDYLDDLIPYQKRKTARAVELGIEESGNPMFKGYLTHDHNSLWQVFFYRFVNPESRIGRNLNYAERIRQGRAYILPDGWVLIHCPALDDQHPIRPLWRPLAATPPDP